jgi:hypothetical protein
MIKICACGRRFRLPPAGNKTEFATARAWPGGGQVRQRPSRTANLACRPQAGAIWRFCRTAIAPGADDLNSRHPDQNLCSYAGSSGAACLRGNEIASNLPVHHGAPEARNCPKLLAQPSAAPLTRRAKSRHPDQNLRSPDALLPDRSELPRLVVGIPPFPRIRAGDLARRLIPWTAALLAGGFETSRGEALLRPPDLHSAGRSLRGNP